MAKYLFDKKALKGLSLLPFVMEPQKRESIIQSAEPKEIQTEYAANRVAKALHPSHLCLKVVQVENHGNAKTYTLMADYEKGTKELAYFRAGQYIVVALFLGDSVVSRPYSIASSPKSALGEQGYYKITVKEVPDGFVSAYILHHWDVGMSVITSGPLGHFYYQSLRDEAHIIACAGGSGITPFLSMAEAIADGTESMRMTILYGVRNASEMLFADHLQQLETQSNGKIKVIPVLSDEEKQGWKHGFLSAELIAEAAGEAPYSLFVCGPKAMQAYMKEQIPTLGLPKRLVRFDLGGSYGSPCQHPNYPNEKIKETYQLKIHVRGELYETTASSDEPILVAVERAGIFAPADCRSGECGWCHSRLLSGEVFIPPEKEQRRMADQKFGWIHPCVTYALSDIEMEIFPIL